MDDKRYEFTLYQKRDGEWFVMITGTTQWERDTTREDVKESLADFVRSELRKMADAPKLNEVVAVTDLPGIGRVAVDGFGREQKMHTA